MPTSNNSSTQSRSNGGIESGGGYRLSLISGDLALVSSTAVRNGCSLNLSPYSLRVGVGLPKLSKAWSKRPTVLVTAGEDTKLKFVMEPKPGNEAFRQWCDAMRGVARLPLGLPTEIRKKVWLSLANQHITVQKYDWARVLKFAFNERSNPDDDALGLQIVKDLHRTGCDTFTTEPERAVLKRVLLAYARWNKRVGYCQGFNVLAAIILEVMQRNEEDSLKVMVYLVDHILPESYFAQNLQALSIDMAVFRELLNSHVPRLAVHLNYLQTKSQNQNCYGNSQHYEPPLTNVFTMQWFLTLFATCLPPEVVLRIWDSIMLEGSEIILRTGLVIWELLEERLLKVKDADSFYCTMRDLTVELGQGRIVQAEALIHRVYTIAPIPFPSLAVLRDRFTYNINPFSSIPSAIVSYGDGGNETCDEEEEEDDPKTANRGKNGVGCFASIKSPTLRNSDDRKLTQSLSSIDISQVGPGAVWTDGTSVPSSERQSRSQAPMPPGLAGDPSSTPGPTAAGATTERMSTDLPALEVQYRRIKHKQKCTTLRMAGLASPFVEPTTTTTASGHSTSSMVPNMAPVSIVAKSSYPALENSMVNHLLLPPKFSTVERAPRCLLTRQHCLPSSSTTVGSSSVGIFSKQQRHKAPPGSTVSSSLQPLSDSSTLSRRRCRGGGRNGALLLPPNRPLYKRSLSQSDVATTIDNDEDEMEDDDDDDEDGELRLLRSASMTDISSHPTLLQLSRVANKRGMDHWSGEVSVPDSPQTPGEAPVAQSMLPSQPRVPPVPQPVPDLNSVLERHHKLIQTGARDWSTRRAVSNPLNATTVAASHHHYRGVLAAAATSRGPPSKLLPCEEDNEIGNTARWVAEHHPPGLACMIDAPARPARHSVCSISTASAADLGQYRAIFGSRAGLQHSLAQHRVQRYKDNPVLRSVYASQLAQLN